jgi:NDP-sugar pyrophosphorylase family protein
MKQRFNIVVPMAGRGSRFTEQGYTDSKPFIDVNGKPMIQRVIENLGIEFDKNYMFVLVCLQEDFDKYDFHQFKDIIGHDSYDVVILDDVTEGAAQTILQAKDLINDNTPLLTLNTDQMIDYNSEHMWTIAEHYDGYIPCFWGDSEDWSYARILDNGYVQEVAEKKVISNNATAGYYYWKKGSDFVKYAEQMIKQNSRTNGEFYVAPVYNWAIKDGKKIGIGMVDEIYELGTPEYLEKYLEENNTM